MKVVAVVVVVVHVGCLLHTTQALGNALERRPWTASRVKLRRTAALRQALLTTLQEHRQRLRQLRSSLQESKFQGAFNNVTSEGAGDVSGSVTSGAGDVSGSVTSGAGDVSGSVTSGNVGDVSGSVTSGGAGDVSGSGVRERRDAPAVIYVAVGGGEGGVRCPDAVDAAAVSVSQLVFLSLSLGVFTAITNIATNINNNNNNNNDNSDNNINSNNLNVGANGNAGNQITVEIPFQRSLRTVRSLWAPYSHTPTHFTTTTTTTTTTKHPSSPLILPATPSFFSEGVAASWVLRALMNWSWDLQPLSPPCLGRHLCRLLPGKNRRRGGRMA
ncbi:transcription factor mef2A-like [Portunus trituberculatus]|uniref:transcription factor mef2A-like n=1 Tax=Portunus trituberculatus TaxID=210409 RepID=UPI001E1CD703|nr:transcription factor mef2A-like [Portunus trituberculatus]